MKDKLIYFLVFNEDGVKCIDCILESSRMIAECWPSFDRWLTKEDLENITFEIDPEKIKGW